MTTNYHPSFLTFAFLAMIQTIVYNSESMNNNSENLNFISIMFSTSYLFAPVIYKHKHVVQETNLHTLESSAFALDVYMIAVYLGFFIINNVLIANYITFLLDTHVKLRYLVLPCLITGINLYLVIRAVFTLIRNFKKDSVSL
jgi:hypothetical protein